MTLVNTLSLMFGILGNIVAVLLFVSPISTFWRIVKKRSTEEFSSIPYIVLLLNSCFWTYYGIITQNRKVLVTINGLGAALQVIFVIIFLLFAPRKLKAKTAVFTVILDVGLLVGTILVTRLKLDKASQIKSVGFFCVTIAIISFASPLAAMKTVVTTKSVEYMPFFLSFFSFLCALMWAIYALLVRDLFIGIPNGAGLVLGLAQLILYAVYRNAKPTKSADRKLEEGMKREDQHRQESITVSPNQRSPSDP